MFIRPLFTVIFVFASIAPVQAREFTLPISRTGAMTFYVPVNVGGIQGRALIDTGASYVVISHEMLLKLEDDKAVEYVKNIIGNLATNDTILVSVYTVNTFIIGGCLLHNVDVVVLHKPSRLIIGWSVLRRLGKISFDTRNGKAIFTVSNCNKKTSSPIKEIAQGK